jgi:hypothetical protein
MRCARCGGLMVLEEFKDFGLESCGNGFLGRRCINCGAIVDPVIAVTPAPHVCRRQQLLTRHARCLCSLESLTQQK